MPHFVWSSSSLPGTKTDVEPPDNPSQQWAADDSNRVFQALYDVRDAFTGSLLEISSARFGVIGNGVVDDAPAIQAAMDVAAVVFSGTYGGFVSLPRGVCALGSTLRIPNGVGLRGAGTSATMLRAKSTFSGSSLIRNEDQDGTQEYAFLESLQIDGNRGNGAICGAIVDFTSLFINSYIRDVLIMNGSHIGLNIAAASAMGPVYIENVWVVNNSGHNVMIKELPGNTGTAQGIFCVNLTSEHQGTSGSAIYLSGSGRCTQWNFLNTHIEMGGADTARTGVTIDGVSNVLFDGLQILTGGGASTGIKITNHVQNVGIQIRGVTNINLINPILQDLKNGVTVGAENVHEYVTADVKVRGGPRFTPNTGSFSAAYQDAGGTDRVWFDNSGSLTGFSQLGQAAVDIVGDATNNRTIALVNRERSRVFGWSFPDTSNIRFRYITGGVDLLNFDNSGITLIYNQTRFLSSLRLEGEISPSQITSNQDNYNPSGFSTAVVLILTSDAARDITGFANPVAGRTFFVYNNGSQNITLKHLTTSTAANQIVGVGSADTVLTPKTGALIYYSSAIAKHIILSYTL